MNGQFPIQSEQGEKDNNPNGAKKKITRAFTLLKNKFKRDPLSDAEIKKVLAKAMEEGGSKEREKVLKLTGELSSPGSEKFVFEALRDESHKIRILAVNIAMKKMADRDPAFPKEKVFYNLSALVGDEYREVRNDIAIFLSSNEDSLRFVRKYLYSKNPHAKETAIDIFAHTPSRATGMAFLELLKDTPPYGSKTREKLIEGIAFSYPYIKSEIYSIIQRTTYPKKNQHVRKKRNKSSNIKIVVIDPKLPFLKAAVVRALGYVGDREAVLLLRNSIVDNPDDYAANMEMVKALGKIRTDTAIEALRFIAKTHPSTAVKVEAVKQLQGDPFSIGNALSYSGSKSTGERKIAIGHITSLPGDFREIHLLKIILSEEVNDVLVEAIKGIRKLPDERFIEPLKKIIIGHNDEEVLTEAANSLNLLISEDEFIRFILKQVENTDDSSMKNFFLSFINRD